jgi:hypothetical protein
LFSWTWTFSRRALGTASPHDLPNIDIPVGSAPVRTPLPDFYLPPLAVCTENPNTNILVMQSAQNGA